jgi:hypothetical protein
MDLLIPEIFKYLSLILKELNVSLQRTINLWAKFLKVNRIIHVLMLLDGMDNIVHINIIYKIFVFLIQLVLIMLILVYLQF